jgi:predicted phosphodiesterase
VRVAALNDIHGNLLALDAALADVERAGADVVVCGGDVVGGPFSTEVYDRLAGQPDVRFLHGNADRLVVAGTNEHEQDWRAERERLGEARVRSFAAWPLTVELRIETLGRVLFCHAIPTTDEPIFTKITPDPDVRELNGDVDADVVVCGHTHVQFDRLLPGGPRIVNAGSVGMPCEGRSGAFWALLGPDVELRHTEYDVAAAVVAIRQAGGEPHEQLCTYLLEPPDPDETSEYFEGLRGA